MIYTGVMEFKNYLVSGYSQKVQEIATGLSVNVEPIHSRDFLIGWQDPFSLPRYPSLLIVTETINRNVEEQTLDLPIWVFVALKDKDPSKVAEQQLVYCDASLEYLSGPNTSVFMTVFNEATPYTPVNGIGVVEINATLRINILGG